MRGDLGGEEEVARTLVHRSEESFLEKKKGERVESYLRGIQA